MRTIIRLQKIGTKDLRKFRIVVQGHYKNLKGRYIEHLGYWFTKENDDHGRSIILNKNRLRYWISVGAVFNHRVQTFLNFAGLMCQPWTSFGKKTQYNKESPEDRDKRRREGFEYLLRQHPSMINKNEATRKLEEENMILRKMKYEQYITEYLPKNNDEALKRILEEPKDQSYDPQLTFAERSEKFLLLKKEYENVERNSPNISPLKKELIYKKLNELAEFGILNEEELKEQSETESNDISVEKAVYDNYQLQKKEGFRKLEKINELFSKVSLEDVKISLKENTNLTNKRIDEIVKDLSSTVTRRNIQMTKMDLEILLMQLKLKKENKFTGISKYDGESFPEPTLTITPIPEIGVFDPKDWYSLHDYDTEIKPHVSNSKDMINVPPRQPVMRDNVGLAKKLVKLGVKTFESNNLTPKQLENAVKHNKFSGKGKIKANDAKEEKNNK